MNKKYIRTFEYNVWIQVWAGNWSLLSCSYFGDAFTKKIKFNNYPFVSKNIILIKDGKSESWIRNSDKDKAGKFLANKITQSPSIAKKMSKELMSQVDIIVPFEKQLLKGKISTKSFRNLWEMIYKYYKLHVAIKYVPDYLEKEISNKIFNFFEKARLYAEPVYELSEKIVIKFAEQQSSTFNYLPKHILSLTKEELYDLLYQNKHISRQELIRRHKSSAILFDKTSLTICDENQTNEIEKIIFKNSFSSVVKGVSAYPGLSQGIARIVVEPGKRNKFKNGEILVSTMTRPDFLPLMRKASAFVTDSGGVLCHAAIVAREMKKPCVIGTKIATKIFKDGDIVEVDANKGIVRKIS